MSFECALGGAGVGSGHLGNLGHHCWLYLKGLQNMLEFTPGGRDVPESLI